jgi:hypothetical protein
MILDLELYSGVDGGICRKWAVREKASGDGDTIVDL